MDEDKADNSKEKVKSFVNDHDNLKAIESKKRKHISTWIGAFKVKDKAFQVNANHNRNIGFMDKATNLPYAEVK
ncbi:MAG: hypothetical protein ABI405_11430 [Parafilimonas sp.]